MPPTPERLLLHRRNLLVHHPKQLWQRQCVDVRRLVPAAQSLHRRVLHEWRLQLHHVQQLRRHLVPGRRVQPERVPPTPERLVLRGRQLLIRHAEQLR
jgi:hypothetical protein